MFRFADSQFLYLLFLVPIVLLFFVWAFRQKRRALATFAGAKLAERLTGLASVRRQWFKAILVLLGLALLVAALARPQFGSKVETVERKGQDIVIALDVSLSMMARDIQPNRLQKAKHAMRSLIEMSEGDRIGLIAFAGEAFVQCPLTLDKRAATMLLNAMGPDLIPVPGTALTTAMQKSLTLFTEEEKKHKVLVLITDGEGHSGEPIKVAREAAEQGIRIYTVGIGSPQGTPIPLQESGKVRQGFKKDGEGEVVVTRLDEATLREIAEQTGGEYYRASPGASELENLYSSIAGMDKKTLSTLQVTQFEERFQILILLALFLLVVELVLADRRKVQGVWKGRFP